MAFNSDIISLTFGKPSHLLNLLHSLKKIHQYQINRKTPLLKAYEYLEIFLRCTKSLNPSQVRIN